MGKRILVVDDEKLIVKGIRFSLEQEGMEVDCAYDGEEALEYAKGMNMILSFGCDDAAETGCFQVCQQIRDFRICRCDAAKSEDMDKILGLEYGADDYITKPFNILGGEGEDQSHHEADVETERTGRRTGADQRKLKD